ncbi:hypothetical protein L1987_14466 [Smallanthus sonchifolius]|uniref:Uncharacterized protein n=1 Tax=Smallanthus sonchifolius TaxID=185202 RepID=A0ACB9J3X2_9ASTR|nr:hypothetical protein L1987_14466 [Smallanthus sonchifolius]
MKRANQQLKTTNLIIKESLKAGGRARKEGCRRALANLCERFPVDQKSFFAKYRVASVEYLKMTSYPIADELKKCEPERLSLPWHTVKNSVDCERPKTNFLHPTRTPLSHSQRPIHTHPFLFLFLFYLYINNLFLYPFYNFPFSLSFPAATTFRLLFRPSSAATTFRLLFRPSSAASLVKMAQCLAPSVQWQMRLTKNAMEPSSMTSKMWNSFSLKPSRKGALKTSTKFRICASANGTINRMEDLLNLDVSPYTDKIIAEYIWIGGSGTDVRSKSRTLSKPVEHPSELPKWNYDGSSTGQAPGEDSEVILYPQAIFRDPFRGGKNILVICDAYTPQGEPIPTNKRAKAAEIFSDPKVVASVPWFGIEQEYTLLQPDVNWPLGWPVGGYPGPQGPYYCGAGADKSFGRDISDAHYKACLYAGINISGTNGEVMPGQWEFQVGPSVGIEAGDHIWCARYLLERITEQAGVVLTLDPKPIEGDWNGAGCHTNYSTKTMREDGGFEVIKKAILNLSFRHKEHISAYGEGNERRLTGKHETASINQFSWGVANRGCSIRVGRDTEKAGKGYLEDRRPASNMDPYTVTGLLAETTILWEPTPEASWL